jgi:hypothetical protein
MKRGSRLPTPHKHIYQSEVMYGYEGKAPCAFSYRVDGKFMTLKQVRPLVPSEISDACLSMRLRAHYQTTLEALCKPVKKAIKDGRLNGGKKGSEVANKRRTYAKQVAADKRVHFAKLKSGHKEI